MDRLSLAGTVICLTVVAVILINAAILMFVQRRRPGASELEALRRLGQGLQNPTGRDQAQLEELSRRVAQLSRGGSRPPPAGGSEGKQDGG
jgi:hypothetical protein